jgi:hydrogenase maturation protease
VSVSWDGDLAKVAVLGMGNEVLKDEGIGVHVVRCLEKVSDLGPVRLVDGGTSPDAIDLVQDVERLIIIDAARCGGEPGAVYRLSPEQVQSQKPSSVHEMTVIDMLWSMEILGSVPEVTIFGVEPKEIDWGLELSPELEEKLPKIVKVVEGEIRRSLSSKLLVE